MSSAPYHPPARWVGESQVWSEDSWFIFSNQSIQCRKRGGEKEVVAKPRFQVPPNKILASKSPVFPEVALRPSRSRISWPATGRSAPDARMPQPFLIGVSSGVYPSLTTAVKRLIRTGRTFWQLFLFLTHVFRHTFVVKHICNELAFFMCNLEFNIVLHFF